MTDLLVVGLASFTSWATTVLTFRSRRMREKLRGYPGPVGVMGEPGRCCCDD